MKKKVIVFGSSGFIGSALCRKFTQSGYVVYGCDLDNNSLDKPDYFFPHTLLDTDPHKIFSVEYDLCVNCAGSASVPYSFQDPFKDYELNTRIVFKILNELKKSGSGTRFINMSSAAVYGNPKSLPITEQAIPRPISPYGNHKLMSEMIVEQFTTHFGVQGVSLRIFSAYGPGLKKQIFWDLYQKALKSEVIEMHGTGNETRDFIYIEDLVSALLLIAEAPNPAGVYNVANGSQVRIKEVVDIFCSYFGDKRTVRFNGVSRQGDPDFWCADISRLKELGYQQKFTIDRGIQHFIDWAKQENL